MNANIHISINSSIGISKKIIYILDPTLLSRAARYVDSNVWLDFFVSTFHFAWLELPSCQDNSISNVYGTYMYHTCAIYGPYMDHVRAIYGPDDEAHTYHSLDVV